MEIAKLNKAEKQKLFAAQEYIKEQVKNGCNEFKLKKNVESIKLVLSDRDKFPYYMKLGTGKQAKSIKF